MAIKKYLKKLALAFGLMNMSLGLSYPSITYAEIIEETVNDVVGEYRMGGDDTPEKAEKKALDKAKRLAAERVMVKVESSSDMENFKLLEDSIKSYTIATMQILDQKPTVWDNLICRVTISARVKIDTEAIKNASSSQTPQSGNTAVSVLNDKEVRAEGEYQMGGNDTMEKAKNIALKNAITNASMTAGVQVRNFTKVNNFIVSDDVIETYTQSKVRVKSQEWKNEGFLFKVTIIAEVDLDENAMREYFNKISATPATVTPPVVTTPTVPVTPAPPIVTTPTVPTSPPQKTYSPVGGEKPDKSKATVFKDNLHHYQVVDAGLDWDRAKAVCEEAGGHLVTIGSAAEQKFIENLLKGQGQRNSYWIGGTKSISGTPSWVDGTPFKYTNWAKGQPDNLKERALMIYKNVNPNAPAHVLGTWNDLSSDGTFSTEAFFGLNNFGLICEWDS